MRAAVLAAAMMLSGCVSTIGTIVTAPVRVVSKGVDLATTSQSEADEKRGKAVRQRDARVGKLERDRTKAQRQCDEGNRDACDRVEELGEAIEDELRRPD